MVAFHFPACLLALLVIQHIHAHNPQVRFVDTDVRVEEGSSTEVRIEKIGIIENDITIIVEISRPSVGDEFIGSSRVLTFRPSDGANVTKQVMFTARDDDLPEIAEVFTLSLDSHSSNSQVITFGSPSTSQITISANDDAYGVIQFSNVSTVTFAEGSTPTQVSIPLTRSRGTFGVVTVIFQIVGSPANQNEDISPIRGVVAFEASSSSATLDITILPDQLPEYDESFSVQLLSTSGGATLNEPMTSLPIVIIENDSPIHFSQAVYYFLEAPRTVTIGVLRGLSSAGEQIGPVNEAVTVVYEIMTITTDLGVDFFATNGSLTFVPGQTEQQISIRIFDDDIPELDEFITVELTSIIGNAVIDQPSACEVVILANDDQHGVLSLEVRDRSDQSLIVDEDDSTMVSDFVVIRSGGTFGEVRVDYEIIPVSAGSTLDDITPGSGTITIPDGADRAEIVMDIVDDPIPEEAETFLVRLVNDSVTGGAVLSGTTEGSLIIRDSDDAYGIIQFSSDSDQIILSQPRRVQLLFTRGGGTIGDLTVTLNATYSPANSSAFDFDVLRDPSPLSTVIPSGVSVHALDLPLNANAFLQIGSTFIFTLADVTSVGTNPVVPPSSPVLGAQTTVTLEVTPQLANGEVGFSQGVTMLEVEEPDGVSIAEIAVNVTREGTSGDATVYWRIMPHPGSDITGDLAFMEGYLQMSSGVETTSIPLLILPDTRAETDESFTLELYNVTPASQRLREGDTSLVVTILENDNPGGFFEFSPETLGPFYLSEGSDVDIRIVRRGGALVERQVLISAGEDGNQFHNIPNVVLFPPGVVSKSLTVIPRPDGIPELNMTFDLVLLPYGDPPSEIGSTGAVTLAVMENDDPYGVIHFHVDRRVVFARESSSERNGTAEFEVVRDQGSFGEVSISWVASPVTLDLYPIEGTITFPDGVNVSSFEIWTIDDQFPELNETFSITLLDPTGGSRLATPTTAQLIINSNDEAIYIEDIATCAVEPQLFMLSVIRNGSAATPATVSYRTVQGSALQAVDYVATEGVLSFDVGVVTAVITVRILDDPVPEASEVFELELYDAIGDIVIVNNPRTRVPICANDIPGGLFSFRPPVNRIGQEGESLEVTIERGGGMFGALRVYWLLFDSGTSARLQEGQEFEQVQGYVEFQEGQTTGTVFLRPSQDGIPEFEEVFFLSFLNITVDDVNLEARIDPQKTRLLNIIISPNDDPYGVLSFMRTEHEVAEDFLPGSEMSSTVDVTVSRNQGLSGNISVIWEILSDSVAAGWPYVLDLLFVSDVETSWAVLPAPLQRRLQTGTIAYSFTGGNESFIRVPPDVEFVVTNVDEGLTISAWVIPSADCNGFVASKVNATRPVVMFYGLKLDMTNPQSAYVEFQYSTTEGATNFAPGFTLSFATAPLNDGQWHLLAATVDSETIIFFVDGEQRHESPIQGPLADGDGIIYVGASGYNMRQFEGLMQDVRFYGRKLLSREIYEVWSSPAQTDFLETSGILTFDPEQEQNSLEAMTSPDDDPESNELYQVILVTSRGGATIMSGARTLIAVLKSDNANGLFGFDGPCLSSGQDAENTTFSCLVQRSRGDTGVVTLPWEVRNRATGHLAVEDFVNSTGEVVFQERVREMTIRLTVLNDVLPELGEAFEVILVDLLPLSQDGLVGSTNVSGASIDNEASVNIIQVRQSDNPFGLFQFSLGDPPLPSDPLLAPATAQVELRVMEDVGVARLLVVRAQGLLGEVMLEWRTIDGSAVSAGKDPIDFSSGGGTLSFANSQRFAFIDITILDNSIPELEKTFQVELSNPTGGAALGPGSLIEVTIESSDNAYGIFELAESAVLSDVDEGDIVQLQVVRSGGVLGEVNLYWTVMADAASPEADALSDISNPDGNLSFISGQSSAFITMVTANDGTPELDESFVVFLEWSDFGSIGPRNTSEFIVLANDDPYGVVVFSAESLTVRVPEGNTTVTLQVNRERGTKGTVQVSYSTLSSVELLPAMPPYVSRAEEGNDFIPVRGSLVFSPGQTDASIQVLILDDKHPESEESIFIAINRVFQLGSQPVVGSPRFGNTSIAEIEILANDNANGVLQLSAGHVVVSEDSIQPVINVTRTAGTFGTVTVKFQTIPGSALSSADYSVTSTDVILYDGETSKPLPIEIINDRTPELGETFRVRLLDQITGGAILGTPQEAEILIEPSDDPNGNFGFSTPSQIVIEPDNSRERLVTVNLIRNSGLIGVVAVEWQAILDGVLATADVFPTGGTLHFLSGDTTQSFTIRVLPDDVPEEREGIEVSLVSATGGGVIGDLSLITITIEANDDPHGVVEFMTENNNVMEVEGFNGVASIPIFRRGGLFGDLEVSFSTQPADLVLEATKLTTTVFDFYYTPIIGSLNGIMKNSYDVSDSLSPLTACAEGCLVERACGAFEYQQLNATVLCLWSLVGRSGVVDETSGFNLYMKNTEMTHLLYESQAVPGTDFLPVVTGSVRIPAGDNSSSASVIIFDDLLPERGEVFLMNLLSVRVVDSNPLEVNRPTIGSQSQTRVTIESNDDANGIWAIYSNSPNAVGPSTVLVQEREGLSISEELIIERRGGTIGDVSVSWMVSHAIATANLDYTASGGTVNFRPGETRQVINIGIKDDDLPEDDESFIIEIYNPTGGSVLSDQNNVTIVILANDNVAGILRFSQLSYIVDEGEAFNVTIQRSPPATGVVYVSWSVIGSSGHLPEHSFIETNGSLWFEEGVLVQFISLTVLSDDTPESNEEFVLTLTDIFTEGVSQPGAASLDPRASATSITIQASDEPHGVFSFAQGSLSVRVEEGDRTIELFVERKFGSIGVVEVGFTIGQISDETVVAATGGLDFAARSGVIQFVDGQNSVPIVVQIREDGIPELDELFQVQLTSVRLIDPAGTSLPPKLGTEDTSSRMTITANDGTQGVVSFNVSRSRLTVPEASRNLSLTILRDRGTYGEVTVFLYSQPIDARKGVDYFVEDEVLVFGDGDFIQEVIIQILDDETPEDREAFQLILDNPTGGLELGELARVTVNILPNDDAFGVISFSGPTSVTVAEPEDVSSQASSLAQFTLVRERGTSGQVEVPFTVEGGQDDISPQSGFVTFESDESIAVLQISAFGDSFPELREEFIVRIGEPIGGATLGDVTEASIIVEESDAPYGLLEIFPIDSRSDTIEVEEDDDVVYYAIERSGGQIGTITVDVTSRPGTAVSTAGSILHLGVLQTLNTTSPSDYHSFTIQDDLYLVVRSGEVKGHLTSLIGSDGSVVGPPGEVSTLYKWQGVYVPVQTIETDGATDCASQMIGGSMYLAVANQGTPGRRVTSTRIYRVQSNGTLIVIQDIPTTGASAVAFLTRGSDTYLVIGQQYDATEDSITDSLIYLWNGMVFVARDTVPTTGAVAIESFEIGGDRYVAIASYYSTRTARFNIRSKIYLWQNGALNEHQQLDTFGASDMESVAIGTGRYLVVANRMNDDATDVVNSAIYRWDFIEQQFMIHQYVPTSRCQSVTSFTTQDGSMYLIFADSAGPSLVFVWNSFSNMFEMSFVLKSLNVVGTVETDYGGLMIVATTADIDQSETRILQPVTLLQEADFVPWSRTLTFTPDDTRHVVAITVLPDDTPEDDETFTISLSAPTGGAIIGPHNQVSTIITSNDDAHGIVVFAHDSLQTSATEEMSDTPVVLTVERQRGTAGIVVVAWEATGDHDMVDLRPLSGQIEFGDGIPTVPIVITVVGDSLPELDEVTFIRLTRVVNPGTSRVGRGAVIGSEDNTAQLTVMANDSPHGVFGWSINSLYAITDEPEGSQLSRVVTLVVMREQGRTGTVNVYYSTFQSSSVPEIKQAVSDRDFVARSNSYVTIGDGEDTASVGVTILPDTAAEGPETFYVNLTSVDLISGIPQRGAAPSVKNGQNVAEITIRQNDNANGILQFNAVKNDNGEVEVYEGSGTDGFLHLPVTRSAGAIGIVGFGWSATTISASSADFSPMRGNVTMADGQREATIDISIIDDEMEEADERFTVSINSPTGGAVLGEGHNLLIKILKNDSPRGLFGFSYVQETVAEGGEVSFSVERTQGSRGAVTIQWELEAAGRQDLSPPQGGTLSFQEGTLRRRISLRALRDTLLEGEERFVVSISSEEDVEISPVRDRATVIIQPDPGSSGVVSILPQYRNILLGEPTSTHDGTAMIILTRGVGIFGEVEVSWQISPSDDNTFQATSGRVTFIEGQQNASIILQTVDDDVPELKQEYTLILASITGGAAIDDMVGANQATLNVVASDYPFGIFEFQEPTQIAVDEDIGQVSLLLVRQAGIYGTVQVAFNTISGTATSEEDYLHKSAVATFPEGVDVQRVTVTILPDGLPEGPETFTVDLTTVTLLSPLDVSYTDVNGLQLDMEPMLGAHTQKEITIEKNDNAEGIIEFTDSLLEVSEDIGTVPLKVVRTRGSFGHVSALYTVQNLTASPDGIDYILTAGEVVFLDGQSTAYIQATIIDDKLKEFSETFMITLTTAQGGAVLGSNTTKVVGISKSDGPDGLIGFVAADLLRIIPNPAEPGDMSFTVELSGGTDEFLTGTEVRWQILGPNSEDVLSGTEDISTVDGRLRGSVTYDSRTRGQLTVDLRVKPFSGPEVQEVFLVEIYQVIGAGEVVSSSRRANLTILKNGDPNGILQFDTDSQQTMKFSEPDDDSSPMIVSFGVQRRMGLVGDIQVYWEVHDDQGMRVTSDLSPTNGTVDIPSGISTSRILLGILPDTDPELEERFQLVLVSSQGGAEIDPGNSVAEFSIRPNDDPHGIFSISDGDQTITVSDNLSRSLRIQVNRAAGTMGSVLVNFDLRYNDGVTGAYVPPRGSVTCSAGEVVCRKDVPLINNNVFLERDTTFTVNLTSASYIGGDVSFPPLVDPLYSTAMLTVPQAAANSKVGFLQTGIDITEDLNQVMVTVDRIGSYGSLDVNWQAGYPMGSLPPGYMEGAITPSSGLVRFSHGQSQKPVTVLLNPMSIQELFALHIMSVTSTSDGDAQLDQERSLIEIAPSGLVGFDQRSRDVRVAESMVQVTLIVQRILGAQGVVSVNYQTTAGSATPENDYVGVLSGAVTMTAGQQTAPIIIRLQATGMPEQDETFSVDITSVQRLDDSGGNQPLLSNRYSVATVIIEANNDPFGVLGIIPGRVETTESEGICKLLELTVNRTGGLSGEVAVVIRTVGGGEPWETDAISQFANETGTIGAALSAGQSRPRASVGSDYLILEETIIFRENEHTDRVRLSVCDDNIPEPDEYFYVYIAEVTGGARVSGPGDGDMRGYTEVIILGNDNYNGILGFSDSSLFASVSEDDNPTVTLTIDRGEAFYDALLVEWRATYSTLGDVSQDVDLNTQLTATKGDIECLAGIRMCNLQVTLINDLEPEFAQTFAVELLAVGPGASIDPSQRFANVTMEDSDHPYGQFGFSLTTRGQSLDRLEQSVTLNIERYGGRDRKSSVSWETKTLTSPEKLGGVTTFPASPGIDFIRSSGTVQFPPAQRRTSIQISLPGKNEGEVYAPEDYPKQFTVELFAATNGASVDTETGVASIIIADSDLSTLLWDQWLQTGYLDGGDAQIQSVLTGTANFIGDNALTQDQMLLVLATLNSVIDEGYERQFSLRLQNQILAIFCDLLDPNREDSRGVYRIAKALTRFSYTLLTGLPCSPNLQDGASGTKSLECDLAKVQAARWPSRIINGHRFDGRSSDLPSDHPNHFTLPPDLLEIEDDRGSSCEDVHFIEYDSQQWFLTDDSQQVLSQQVLSVGIKGAETNFTNLATPVEYRIYTKDNRVTPKGGQCVIFSPSSERWLPSSCQVQSDQYNFVECACNHLSEFAAEAQTDNLVGYNVAVYISCFIVIGCFFLALLTHTVCSVFSMFAARLLMHMCFAGLCLEVVFVTAAHVSERVSPQVCTTLGLLIHYFLLAQFSWIFIQGVNFWKVFVMNDEHTVRYYIIFFVTGWTLPLIVILFYVVIMYAAFDWPLVNTTGSFDPSMVIYGDVRNSKDICFIPNGYAALASVVGPALAALLAVVIILMQAYQVKPQWKRYDDIYMGRYNTTEVKLIFIFWALISFTWLFAGLHLAFGQLWLLIIFIIFNCAQGLYAFLVYTVLRNQLCKPSKGNYSLDSQLANNVTLLENHRYNSHSNLIQLPPGKGGSLNGTLTKSNMKDMAAFENPVVQTTWDTESVGQRSHHSLNLNQMVKPPSIHGSNLFAPSPFHEAQPAIEEDDDSQEFDDLIFALKTGGALPVNESGSSVGSKNRSPGWPNITRSTNDRSGMTDTTSDSVDHYEVRKLAIADTHL